MPTTEFEVTAPEDHWLTLTEISDTGFGNLRVPCSDTGNIEAVEGAILAANMSYRYEHPGRLIAFVGRD
jgi:hypothetical protein